MKFLHRVHYILLLILFVLICQLFILNRSVIKKVQVNSNSKPTQLVAVSNDIATRRIQSALNDNKFILNSSENMENASCKTNKSHLFSFKFVINQEDLCKMSGQNTNDKTFIVFLINSHYNNFFRRKAMRDTWLQFTKFNLSSVLNPDQVAFVANKYNLNESDVLHIRHVFILGQGDNMNNKTIQEEANEHNDLLVLDENETYQNIVQKHLALIEWAINNCSNSYFAVKMDDDVFVNIKLLVQHLFLYEYVSASLEPFTYCNCIEKAKPIRNNMSKWAIDEKQYSKDFYPLYCEGFAYITNINTFRIIKKQLLDKNTPYVWIDDLYVTGILLEGQMNIKRIKFNQRFRRNNRFEYSLRTTYFNTWNEKVLRRSFIENINFLYRGYIFIVVHSHQGSVDVNYDQITNSNQLFEHSFYNKKLECEMKAKMFLSAKLNYSVCFDSLNEYNSFYFLRFFRGLWRNLIN